MKSRYHILLFWISLLIVSLSTACGPRYDPETGAPLERDIRKAVNSVVKSMTLEEKVGQLLCPMGWPMYEKIYPDSVTLSASGLEFIKERHGGWLWATFRADPWTQKTLETGLSPVEAAHVSDACMDIVNKFGTPGLYMGFFEEAPHGVMAIGTTVFPTGIGQAASWNPILQERIGEGISDEMRCLGASVALGPVIDLARDPRWSRVEETYGEDPFLTGEMAAAMVKGIGFRSIATLKHFIAYGNPQGGHNGNPVSIGQVELRESYLPPFKRAIEAGARVLMTAYNSIDGIPATSHEALLTGVLRDEWGFEGLVISDLGSIDGLATTHHIATDRKEAAELALKAGVDIDLGAGCYPLLVESVLEGRISERLVDRAVKRVVRLKMFRNGCFSGASFPGISFIDRFVHSPHAVSVALQSALESVTLLENNGVLPLKPSTRIALVGPNADNVYNQLGDYTAPQAEGKVVTMLDGLRARGVDVRYAKGCAIRDTRENGIAEAVRVARSADVVVAVVGGSSARDFRTSYEETGAAVTEEAAVSDMEAGEGFDRSSLDLLGLQPDLLKALKATGKPLVVVYIEGRPLDKRWAKDNADALLTLWYPGEQGGTALAHVLFGDYNPAGRLPISVPRDAGQLPVYYNQRIPRGHDYVEQPASPLYPFGYGLSYTTFSYGDLRLATGSDASSVMPGSDRASVPTEGQRVSLVERHDSSSHSSAQGKKVLPRAGHDDSGNLFAIIDVTNTGDRDGEEVVQLYLIDEIASTVRPRKQLCGFARVAIPAGETRTITIPIDRRSFEMVNAAGQTVIEPGSFRIQAGASSEDIRSEITITL